MKKNNKNYLITLFVALSFGVNAQSGWTKGKGEFFGKIDFAQLSTGNYYAPDGANLQTNKFTQSTINFYGEYGLQSRWSGIVSMPLWRQNSFSTTNKVSGMGDLRMDLKYRIIKNQNWPVAISVGIELPTGRANAYAANKSVPQDRINLPTGDGEFNIWTTLAASKSLGPGYISAFTAYNFRTKYQDLPFRDVYQVGAEVGANPFKPLWVNLKIRSQYSTGESKYPELGFVRGDGTTYTLYSAEAFVKFSSKFGGSITYLSGTDLLAPFKNIYISSFLSFGLIYELKPSKTS